jgi:hypothetical protein
MYNKNLDKMNKETLRMQMLSGIITEGQYKAILNEYNENTSSPVNWLVDMLAGADVDLTAHTDLINQAQKMFHTMITDAFYEAKTSNAYDSDNPQEAAEKYYSRMFK